MPDDQQGFIRLDCPRCGATLQMEGDVLHCPYCRAMLILKRLASAAPAQIGLLLANRREAVTRAWSLELLP